MKDVKGTSRDVRGGSGHIIAGERALHSIPGAGRTSLPPRADDGSTDTRPQALLAFERSSPTHPASKARAVRARFGWSLTRYFWHLHRAIDTPEGLMFDPDLCRKLNEERLSAQILRAQAHLKAI